MPKPKQKPTTKSKPSHSQNTRLKTYYKTHPRKTILLLAVAILALVLGIKTVVTQIQIHHERNQFIQAKTDLDTIYTGLIANIGKPDAHRAEQSCHYSSAKFEKGFLTCSVAHYFFYLSADKTAAKMMSQRINTELLINNKIAHHQYDDYLFDNEFRGLDFRIDMMDRCGVQYVFVGQGADISEYKGFINTGARGISGMIFCQSTALKEYFPVIN